MDDGIESTLQSEDEDTQQRHGRHEGRGGGCAAERVSYQPLPKPRMQRFTKRLTSIHKKVQELVGMTRAQVVVVAMPDSGRVRVFGTADIRAATDAVSFRRSLAAAFPATEAARKRHLRSPPYFYSDEFDVRRFQRFCRMAHAARLTDAQVHEALRHDAASIEMDESRDNHSRGTRKGPNGERNEDDDNGYNYCTERNERPSADAGTNGPDDRQRRKRCAPSPSSSSPIAAKVRRRERSDRTSCVSSSSTCSKLNTRRRHSRRSSLASNCPATVSPGVPSDDAIPATEDNDEDFFKDFDYFYL